MGGILAQEFYRLYPERMRCLVLADTYAGWKGSLPEAVWRERLVTCLRDAAGPPGFRLMAMSSAEMDTRQLLPKLDVPTLLLWGDHDRRCPLHVAEQFHLAIPTAELAIIPNAGHMSNMEQPDTFNTHVRRFCLQCAST